LKRIREFNKGRDWMYVFREITCEKASISLHTSEIKEPLVTDLVNDLPLQIRVSSYNL